MRNCQVCRQVSECILTDGNVHNLAHRSVLLPGRSRSNFASFHLIVFLANRWNSTNFETLFNRRFSGDADFLVGKGRKVATLSILSRPLWIMSPFVEYRRFRIRESTRSACHLSKHCEIVRSVDRVPWLFSKRHDQFSSGNTTGFGWNRRGAGFVGTEHDRRTRFICMAVWRNVST